MPLGALGEVSPGVAVAAAVLATAGETPLDLPKKTTYWFAQTRDESAAGSADPVAAAFDPLDGLNANSVLIPYLRTYGLTTTATRPTGGLISGRASVIALDGWTNEDMALDRDAHVFAVSAMFLLFATVQLPALWVAGVMRADSNSTMRRSRSAISSSTITSSR